jgi:ABC-2 family transporter protein
MIWLTWRQFRTQAWVALAALAVIAIGLGTTGLHLVHVYDANGVPACRGAGDCARAAAGFLNDVQATAGYADLYQACIAVLYAVPALIGAFWGAPLITRELEAGTLGLAWTQSISRTRWLTVKVGLIGLASMVTAGLLSLLVTWWAAPVDRAGPLAASGQRVNFDVLGRFTPALFGARGITPVGYAAFAFALGLTAGVLIRHTLAAMAASLAVFAGVQVAFALWVRAHLITPVRSIVPFNPAHLTELSIDGSGQITVAAKVSRPGAWILSNQTVTAAGHPFTGPAPAACVSDTGSFQSCQRALGGLQLRQLVTYQPAGRYWTFQWTETAIFLVLAVALAGLGYWWARRRRLA